MFARIRTLFNRRANSGAPTSAADSPAPHAAVGGPEPTGAFIALVTATCAHVAAGDLEARVTGYSDHPQFGPMSRAINSLLDRTDSYVRETAAAMQTCSNEQFHRPILLRGMEGAFKRSSVIINRAAVKMETSHRQLGRVAQLAQENTTTVTTVAAACEELHATTGEISVRVQQSSEVTRSAVAECDRVSEAVNAMMITAQKAETMITLIDQIAAQTKLLALNASITASHGGPYGQRFGVVATEVKALAHSTASATENIRLQVEAIQQTMKEIQSATTGLGSSMGQIDETSRFIASSLQDQVTATDEITRSISAVSKNTRSVSEQISHVV
jgi:methyl-accepting chemotaxis protein